MSDFKWNGNPCGVRLVLVEVLPSSNEDDFFKWWQPYVGKIMEAVEVIQNGKRWHIYNGDGSGERKVLNGGGPGMSHRSFENYVVQDVAKEVSKFKECKNHEWSEDKEPIFKTKTRYCLKCRTPEVLDFIAKNN